MKFSLKVDWAAVRVARRAAADQGDRLWFLKHKFDGRHFRVRPFVAGELPNGLHPPEVGCRHVTVIWERRRGVRLRLGGWIFCGCEPEELDEERAMGLWVRLSEAAKVGRLHAVNV